MENPKFCINCKHFKIESLYYPYVGIIEYLRCTRDSKIDVIFGNKLPPFKDCHIEREDALRLENERCGYQGIYWEEK